MGAIRRFFLSGFTPAGSFNEQVNAYLIRCRELAADGLTLAEASQLVMEFITLVVQLASTLANSGTEKKAIVLEAVGMLVDTIGPFLLARVWLGWASFFLMPPIKSFVLTLADGAIEAVYRRLFSPPTPIPLKE